MTAIGEPPRTDDVTIEVTLTVPSELASDVGECLFALGVGGIEERESDAGPCLVVFEPNWETAALRLRALSDAGYGEERGVHVSLREVPNEDWRTRWLDDLRSERLTSRVVVVPEHRPLPTTLGDSRALILGRELAFGYGEHASTRVAAVELAAVLDAKTGNGAFTVLDVGSGTGVLGLVAACHGATSVLGVDLDPPSVNIANLNAARNQLADTCRFRETPLAELDEKFDVVIANIELRTLLELLPELRRSLKDEGSLVLAGFLDSDDAELTRAGAAHGLRRAAMTQEDDWIALRFSVAPKGTSR